MFNPSFLEVFDAIDRLKSLVDSNPLVHSVTITRERGELCVRVNLTHPSTKDDEKAIPRDPLGVVRVVTHIMCKPWK